MRTLRRIPVTPEIRAFEYAMGVFSVLIGLAVADIATSFHRLMRSRGIVIWDPLALAAAFYALCMAVYMWFDIWGVRNFAATRHFFFYLALVVELFLLFLVAAASLPDETDEATDLREHYRQIRPYFWGVVSLFQALYVAFGLYFVGSDIARLPVPVSALLSMQMGAPLLISVALLVLKARTAHYIGLALLFGILALHYGSAQIN